MKFRLVALAASLSLALVPTASAHQEIAPEMLPVGKPAFLTLTVANERSTELRELTVAAESGAAFGAATRQPPGWAVRRSSEALVWSGGSVPAGSFEQWGFEIDGPAQPGRLRFGLVLRYSDGTTGNSEVGVTAVSTSGETPAAVPPTTLPAAASGPARELSAGASDESQFDSRATTALVLALVANVVALSALALSVHSKRRAVPRQPGDDGEAEDW